jgi:hypothetical protein
MATTTACPLPLHNDESTLAALLTIDENDVVLTIGELEKNGNQSKLQLSPDEILKSDLEDLESITVVQLLLQDDCILERLERFLLQRRKRGDRVRVFTKQEIPDWGSPTAVSSDNKLVVYENDCRFQMRMQRYR